MDTSPVPPSPGGHLGPEADGDALVRLHRMTSMLDPSSSVSDRENGRCGARLNTTAISETRLPSRLPVRR